MNPSCLGEVLESLRAKERPVVRDCTPWRCRPFGKDGRAGGGRRAFARRRSGRHGPSRWRPSGPRGSRSSAPAAEGQLRRLGRAALLGREVPGSMASCSIWAFRHRNSISLAGAFRITRTPPLDMRMDPGNNTLNAAEVINTYNEHDLARILRVYGERSLPRRSRARSCAAASKNRSKPPANLSRSSRRVSRLPLVGMVDTRPRKVSRPFASRSITSSMCSNEGLMPPPGGSTRADVSASSRITRSRTVS